MKYYKVRLLDGHSARPDQIVDGYIGNGFGSGTVHNQYTRGEAIKKARMFGGKAEFSHEVVFVYVAMDSREGELTNTIKSVHEVDIATNTREFANELARDYYNDENVEDNGKEWLHNSGCIATSILEVTVIDKEDYEVLCRFL